MIDVACATDDYYAPHCATMLRSLFASNPEETALRVHVLHETLSLVNQERFRRLAQEFEIDLAFVEIRKDLIDGFPTDRFHVSCWYRILLPALLPDVARILYLDSDMVVLDSIRPLWDTCLENHLLGAVINPLYPFMPDRAVSDLGLASRSDYLNSGVLLMDLDRMRNEGLIERLLEYARSHPNNPWPEQDALSVVCRGRWMKLTARWNAQTTLFDLDEAQLPFDIQESRAARTRPAIVHFIGPLKPWHYLCRHPLRYRYFEHRKIIPWPPFELEGKSGMNYFLRPLSLNSQIMVRRVLNRMAPIAKREAGRLKQSLLGRIARRIVRKVFPAKPRPSRGSLAMESFAQNYPRAEFIQIGSNDGKKHDPLHAALIKSEWSGVMVEPVKYVFERLQKNYAGFLRIRLENVAVANASGSMPFYYVAKAGADESLPSWYDELGSFRKEVVLKHVDQIPDLESRLLTMDVACVTIKELCERNSIVAPDLLHMDTEGYDYEIIKSIDFDRLRPVLLIYEHKHLDQANREQCKRKLQGHGYLLAEWDADTWCFDARLRDERHEAFFKDVLRIIA